MISLNDYLMGRGAGLAPELGANAMRTIQQANMLLAHYFNHNPDAARPQVASGYRTPLINADTRGAAPNSLHMTCEAIDLTDMPCLIEGRMRVRPLARWCVANLHVLADLDLWMEDPRATQGTTRSWVHVQTRAPRSGLRVFIPDANWAARLAGRPLTDQSIA